MELGKSLFNVNSMNPTRVRLNEKVSEFIAMSTNVKGIRNFSLPNPKHRLDPKLAINKLANMT
jgi:hypothetical protein